MRVYDFNTFDGWFIGPIEDYILGLTSPGSYELIMISLETIIIDDYINGISSDEPNWLS